MGNLSQSNVDLDIGKVRASLVENLGACRQATAALSECCDEGINGSRELVAESITKLRGVLRTVYEAAGLDPEQIPALTGPMCNEGTALEFRWAAHGLTEVLDHFNSQIVNLLDFGTSDVAGRLQTAAGELKGLQSVFAKVAASESVGNFGRLSAPIRSLSITERVRNAALSGQGSSSDWDVAQEFPQEADGERLVLLQEEAGRLSVAQLLHLALADKYEWVRFSALEKLEERLEILQPADHPQLALVAPALAQIVAAPGLLVIRQKAEKINNRQVSAV